MAHRCTDCKHYEWNQDTDTDGFVVGEWLECKIRPTLANLKQFPFKNTECKEFEDPTQ